MSAIQKLSSAHSYVSNVSVIIIAKNESETIDACIQSMFNQSVKPLEVILVDGNSTDDTVEIARKYPVKIIHETGCLSPSNARNIGVENAKGDIVLVIGADAELDKDCIKNAIPYFDDHNLLIVIPNIQIRIHTKIERIQELWFHGTRSRFRTPRGTGSSIQFIRKEVYEKIRYDTSIGFGDDSDFRRRFMASYGIRNFEKTCRVIRAEDSKVFVDLPHTFSEVKAQYLWYGRSSHKYYARHHTPGTILRMSSLLLPFALLVITGFSLIYWNVIYLLIPILALFIARNLIICVRSKSLYFFHFAVFDIMRSALFVYGFFQGFLVKKVGR